MSGEIERDNSKMFAKRVNDELSYMIVDFDSDQNLNEEMKKIKANPSVYIESIERIEKDVTNRKVAFVLDGVANKFREAMKIKRREDDLPKSLTVCDFEKGNPSIADPLKKDTKKDTKKDHEIYSYSNQETARVKATAAYSIWRFFKDDVDDTKEPTTVGDIIAVYGDLSQDEMIKRVAECFSELHRNGRMPQQSKNQKNKYSYTGKIGYVKIDNADTPYYLVGFSITQNVEKVL